MGGNPSCFGSGPLFLRVELFGAGATSKSGAPHSVTRIATHLATWTSHEASSAGRADEEEACANLRYSSASVSASAQISSRAARGHAFLRPRPGSRAKLGSKP